MKPSRSSGWPSYAVLLAGVTWLAVAAGGLFYVRGRAELGLIEGQGLRALLFSLPLIVGWVLVIGSTCRRESAGTWGAALALGLTAGGLAAGLVIVLGWVPPWGPRAPGSGGALGPFVVVALLPQMLGFAAALRLIRGSASPRPRRLLALGAGALVVSFASNAVLGLDSLHECRGTESAARDAIYEIRSAEDAYQELSGGRFTSISCLVAPHDCPGVVVSEPPFLPERWLRPVRCGYRFEFHPGPVAPGSSPPESELEAFAVTAVPLRPGQGRGFCTDRSTVVRFSPDGRMPQPTEGRCSEALEVLR